MTVSGIITYTDIINAADTLKSISDHIETLNQDRICYISGRRRGLRFKSNISNIFLEAPKAYNALGISVDFLLDSGINA